MQLCGSLRHLLVQQPCFLHGRFILLPFISNFNVHLSLVVLLEGVQVAFGSGGVPVAGGVALLQAVVADGQHFFPVLSVFEGDVLDGVTLAQFAFHQPLVLLQLQLLVFQFQVHYQFAAALAGLAPVAPPQRLVQPRGGRIFGQLAFDFDEEVVEVGDAVAVFAVVVEFGGVDASGALEIGAGGGALGGGAGGAAVGVGALRGGRGGGAFGEDGLAGYGSSHLDVAHYIVSNMEGDSHDVIAYLARQGYNFQNERQLFEACREERVLVWDILAHCLHPYEPAAIRSILVSETHAIGDDIDRHTDSLPFLQKLFIVREMLQKLGVSCSLQQLAKPTPAVIIPALRKVIEFSDYHHSVTSKEDNRLLQMHQLQRSCSIQRAKLDSLKLDIDNVQANKERQRPRWEAKEQDLATLRQQHTELQARNIELGRNSFELEKEIKRSEGELLEKQSTIKMRELDMIELRKQLADKYPNIKKEVARKQQFNLESIQQLEAQQRRNLERMGYSQRKKEQLRRKAASLMGLLSGLDSLCDRWNSSKLKTDGTNLRVVKEKDTQRQLEREVVACREHSLQVQQRNKETAAHLQGLQKTLAELIETESSLQQQANVNQQRAEYLHKIATRFKADLQKQEQTAELLIAEREGREEQLWAEMREWGAAAMRMIAEAGDVFRRSC